MVRSCVCKRSWVGTAARPRTAAGPEAALAGDTVAEALAPEVVVGEPVREPGQGEDDAVPVVVHPVEVHPVEVLPAGERQIDRAAAEPDPVRGGFPGQRFRGPQAALAGRTRFRRRRSFRSRRSRTRWGC